MCVVDILEAVTVSERREAVDPGTVYDMTMTWRQVTVVNWRVMTVILPVPLNTAGPVACILLLAFVRLSHLPKVIDPSGNYFYKVLQSQTI